MDCDPRDSPGVFGLLWLDHGVGHTGNKRSAALEEWIEDRSSKYTGLVVSSRSWGNGKTDVRNDVAGGVIGLTRGEQRLSKVSLVILYCPADGGKVIGRAVRYHSIQRWFVVFISSLRED